MNGGEEEVVNELHDDVDRKLREADWNVPWPADLAGRVGEETRRRRRRRLGAVTASTLAAAAVVSGAALALDRPGPAAVAPAAPQPAASAPARIPGSAAAVKVGPWTFDVPPGFTADPRTGVSSARFGPEGLLNDGRALRAQDMRVGLTTVALADAGSRQRLFITRIVPAPTRANPGPRPAADPADRAAAARTVLAVSTQVEAGKAAGTRTVVAPALGTATVLSFTPRNGIVLVIPRGSTEVLLLQGGNTPVEGLVALAESGRR